MHEHTDVQAPQDAVTAAPAREAGPRSAAEFALALQRMGGNAAAARALSRVVRPDARTTTSGQDDTALSYQRHTGSVYVQAAGEHETGINADDVVQGALGDCYFLSPVMAVARINPRKIHRLIRGPVETWADGTRIYDVDLYEGHAIGSPSKRTQRISDRFVTTASGGSATPSPATWASPAERSG